MKKILIFFTLVLFFIPISVKADCSWPVVLIDPPSPKQPHQGEVVHFHAAASDTHPEEVCDSTTLAQSIEVKVDGTQVCKFNDWKTGDCDWPSAGASVGQHTVEAKIYSQADLKGNILNTNSTTFQLLEPITGPITANGLSVEMPTTATIGDNVSIKSTLTDDLYNDAVGQNALFEIYMTPEGGAQQRLLSGGLSLSINYSWQTADLAAVSYTFYFVIHAKSGTGYAAPLASVSRSISLVSPSEPGGPGGPGGPTDDYGAPGVFDPQKVSNALKGIYLSWGKLTSLTPEEIPNVIIQMLVGLVGVVGLLAILWGGYQYMTAAGNEEQEAKAKKTIFYAILGIVVIGAAYAIVFGFLNPQLNI